MKGFSFLALLFCVFLAACDGQDATQKQKLVGIVDLEQILRESGPALAARKHTAAVREVLQKGISELEKEWKDAPEAERNQALAEGTAALQRQLLREEQAANQVVLTLLRDECEKWRATNKALFVTAQQELLATDASANITAEIIEALN